MGYHPSLRSFPTRRSSDLSFVAQGERGRGADGGHSSRKTRAGGVLAARRAGASTAASERRSEEHTSELQSQSNLVCRLLLEKKKLKLSKQSNAYGRAIRKT